jgi:hypothetical protein
MENGMKIDFNEKEYRLLLEVLEMAHWVMHAFKTDEPEETRPFRELEEKVYRLAQEFGCDHLVEYDASADRHFPTREFEDNSQAQAFMDDFSNDCFWDELIHNLVQRDLVRQVGEDRYFAMDPEERGLLEQPLLEHYHEEFRNHGLNRFDILSLQ